MPIRLRDSDGAPVRVPEEGLLPIDLTFYDGGEDGPLVTPTEAAWSLVDDAGEVINERDGVALSVADGAATILLMDDDLAISGAAEVNRRVTVRARYNSATYGDDLPLVQEFEFTIEPLAGL